MRFISGCCVICCLCVSSFASPQSPRASMNLQQAEINPLSNSVESEIQSSIQQTIVTFLTSDLSKKLLNRAGKVSLARINSIEPESSIIKSRNTQHRTAPASLNGTSVNRKHYQVVATLSADKEVFSKRFMIEKADGNYNIISVSSIQ